MRMLVVTVMTASLAAGAACAFAADPGKTDPNPGAQPNPQADGRTVKKDAPKSSVKPTRALEIQKPAADGTRNRKKIQ